jgi:hypothetical protein
MTEQHDSGWYRREARHARYKAEATSDPLLRDSYGQVAEAYDMLAEVLEQARHSSGQSGSQAADT